MDRLVVFRGGFPYGMRDGRMIWINAACRSEWQFPPMTDLRTWWTALLGCVIWPSVHAIARTGVTLRGARRKPPIWQMRWSAQLRENRAKPERTWAGWQEALLPSPGSSPGLPTRRVAIWFHPLARERMGARSDRLQDAGKAALTAAGSKRASLKGDEFGWSPAGEDAGAYTTRPEPSARSSSHPSLPGRHPPRRSCATTESPPPFSPGNRPLSLDERVGRPLPYPRVRHRA